jgi:hypothetical protein
MKPPVPSAATLSGVVPAKIAASFTMAELAVLTVVARQCRRAGACSLHIDAIAALADCCRTVVKNALRQARLLGLILVKERRIPGRPSLTNIVSVISKEWTAWLKLGGGFKRLSLTNSYFHFNGRKWLKGSAAQRQLWARVHVGEDFSLDRFG